MFDVQDGTSPYNGINSSVDGQLDIYADAELEITAPIVDIDASTSVNISNDLKLDSDACVLGFGDGNDVTLTHYADNGLVLNGTRKIYFEDGSNYDQYIGSAGSGVTAIAAPTEIDLTKVGVEMDEKHTNKIELTEELGIIMEYPTIESFAGFDTTNIKPSNMLDIIVTCIKHI